MIRAEYLDYQRRAQRRWTNNEYFLKEISVKNIFNWEDSTVVFNYPITLITGKNGVGKSTLINAIKHVSKLQNKEENLGYFSSLEGYYLKLINQRNEEIIVENDTLSNNGFKLPKIFDLTFNSSHYSFFKWNRTLEDIEMYKSSLEQYDALPLPRNLLNLMKYFIEKPIKSAERIIDEEENEAEYYRLILENGTIYDTYTMGSGEFFINQFLWGIHDLEDQSIVVIEELENYLHSDAQKKIIQLIHEVCVTKQIQFILTTHSPTLIDHVIKESLILLKSNENNIIPINNCPNWLAKDVLGKTIDEKVCVILEDEKSKALFHTIISQYDPDIIQQLDLVNGGGDKNIKKCIQVNEIVKNEKFIGIVDGDSEEAEQEFLIKLPGTDPPEKVVLLDISGNLESLIKFVDRPLGDVCTIFRTMVTNPEHHEWVSYISHELGEEHDYLWKTITKIWSKDKKDICKDFFLKFEKAFNKIKSQ
ncbi:AAA family ATPase [Methanocalculus sp.]|uniref:ATP-dependent nuclease n=1 Tax=Methanocalculus sp. TaxID=2004547 RepID=UPI00263A0669|nr:AAA family ATPase [Methanocalculus sp.]MDG6251078.1 AAA family ATPase [Methanocalculus sp.]